MVKLYYYVKTFRSIASGYADALTTALTIQATVNTGTIRLRMRVFVINEERWLILKELCGFGFQEDKKCSVVPVANLSYENDSRRSYLF